MNIWVVKSIVKPNTNPTPCTKGMEDSPLDSGQTLISDQTLIESLYHAHTSRVNNCLMSYVHRQPRWSRYMDKLPNQQVNHFHEKLPEFLLMGKILWDQVYSDTQEKMPEKFGYRQFCGRCEQEKSALLRNQKVVTAL